jgi:hypothetical protein
MKHVKLIIRGRDKTKIKRVFNAITNTASVQISIDAQQKTSRNQN